MPFDWKRQPEAVDESEAGAALEIRFWVLLELVALVVGGVLVVNWLSHRPAEGASRLMSATRRAGMNSLLGSAYTGHDLRMRWRVLMDPYAQASSSPYRGPVPPPRSTSTGETSQGFAEAELPRIMQALLIPEFTYRLSKLSPPPSGDAKAASDTTYELRGYYFPKAPHTEGVETAAESPTHDETVEAWKRLKRYEQLFLDSQTASIHPVPAFEADRVFDLAFVSREKQQAYLDSCITSRWNGDVLWRLLNLPYTVAIVGNTQYRVHSFSLPADAEHGASYWVQIRIEPSLLPPGSDAGGVHE